MSQARETVPAVTPNKATTVVHVTPNVPIVVYATPTKLSINMNVEARRVPANLYPNFDIVCSMLSKWYFEMYGGDSELFYQKGKVLEAIDHL